MLDAKIASTIPVKTFSSINKHGANAGPAMTQGLFFLVGRTQTDCTQDAQLLHVLRNC